MAGSGSDDPVQPSVQTTVDETNCENVSSLEKGAQNSAKPGLSSVEGTENSLSNDEKKLEKKDGSKASVVTQTVEKTSVSRDVTNVSAAAQPPPSSVPGNSKIGPKDSQGGSKVAQASIQQEQRQQHKAPPPQPPQRGQPQDLSRKRPREQPSPLPVGLQQAQNLDRDNRNPRKYETIWTRYNLAASDLITSHETAELQVVKKQSWRSRKFVPYNGME